MKKILVSNEREALAMAKAAFADGEEFVLAEGAATMGGAMFEGKYGQCLMHRSGNFVEVTGDIETAKARLQAT